MKTKTYKRVLGLFWVRLPQRFFRKELAEFEEIFKLPHIQKGIEVLRDTQPLPHIVYAEHALNGVRIKRFLDD